MNETQYIFQVILVATFAQCPARGVLEKRVVRHVVATRMNETHYIFRVILVAAFAPCLARVVVEK